MHGRSTARRPEQLHFPGRCSTFSVFQAPKPDQLIKPGRDYNGPVMYGVAPAATAASETSWRAPNGSSAHCKRLYCGAVCADSGASTREATAVMPAGPSNPPPGSAHKLLLLPGAGEVE